MTFKGSMVLAVLASPAMAEGVRDLDSHVHGRGELNIAVDGREVAMELHAPGADIVGFEYAARTAADRAAVDAAVAVLARPLDLFELPAAAQCSVVQASAELESDEEHEDHGDGHDEHDDEHAEEDHAEHEHEHEHDGHGDEHADNDAEPGHTEFHAEYRLTCADPGAISGIEFAYFKVFENAQALEVQLITSSGARAFEVERANPTLDLRGMF